MCLARNNIALGWQDASHITGAQQASLDRTPKLEDKQSSYVLSTELQQKILQERRKGYSR